MYTYQTNLRIRYAETDQMGYCYYGNYPQFFEIGRVETLRSLGVSYKKIEDSGIMLPVLDLNIKYIKPAKYDDLITIKTTITQLPSLKIYFEYEIFNEAKDLLTKGSTTLVFVDSMSRRPIKCPDEILNAFKAHF